MTAKTFSEYIAEVEPQEIRASHYALAPDVYGLDDGYAWAFAEGDNGSPARSHLPDGGEWPYYIAAIPNPASRDRYTLASAEATWDADTLAALTEGRVLETYCEGDLVSYIFEDREQRDTAAERWQESREDFAARVLADEYPSENAEQLAPAVLSEALDGNDYHMDGDELRDRIAQVMDEDFAGEWGSLADYVEDFHRDTITSEQCEAMGDLWDYIDWGRLASDWETAHTTTYPAPGGNVYVFRAV